MASYELLDAVNLRDVRTTQELAHRLGIEPRDAVRQLREAARAGQVVEETDLSASLADDQRQYWILTPEGRELWNKLDAVRA